MITVYFETLGCEKNRVDTEIMMGCLVDGEYEIVSQPDEARVIILNTCGFIMPAVNESLDRILDLTGYKENGLCDLLMIVGCLVERYKLDLMEEIPEIDVVVGTSDYSRIETIISSFFVTGSVKSQLEKAEYSDSNYGRNRVLSLGQAYTYLKIAEGCSNQCSFCMIPRIRGRYKSKPARIIQEEFASLRNSGIKEVNLISQDCSSYGLDVERPENLTQLVRQLLLSDNGDYWLRLFYLYPNTFPVDIIGLMAEDDRLVPYVDIPIQHISDHVLNDMRRKITGAEIESLLENILKIKPDLAIRTTLMVGFPGETDKDFDELMSLVNKGYFTHVGVFEYSPEEGTSACRFADDVSPETKRARKDQIMAAQQLISFKKNKAMVGQKQKVLLEGLYEETDLLLKGRNKYQGADVDGVTLINDGVANTGEFCEVEITEAHPYDLIAKII